MNRPPTDLDDDVTNYLRGFVQPLAMVLALTAVLISHPCDVAADLTGDQP